MLKRNEKTTDLISDDVSDKIQSALKVLDDAASEKGQEIRSSISRSFKDLHHVLTELETGSEVAMEGLRKKGRHLREVVQDRSAKMITEANRQFRTRPWLFIGGFALIGIGVGYLVVRKMRHSL